ncbi:ATP-binding protein [Streptomyces caniscabiei]|uniref:ATP-binding protein n=1 Tax=Streptomyces caniscabiei TaxID=2746961 RepID=UPI000AFF91D3|nr:ATP-binding protein [Streptomyces caniscabiei]
MDDMLRRARLADAGRPAVRPELPVVVPGLYVRHREGGFTAHITASRTTFSEVRRLTATVPVVYGVDQEAVDAAQWVVSELLGNAVRACGDHVPLIVEVYATGRGVVVSVHDPVGELLPIRRSVAMDSDDAESGRGLDLLDVLAPGWRVVPTPLGKQICCHVGGTK